MPIQIPDINIVRFYQSDKAPNYTNYMPTDYNSVLGVKYQDGVYPVKYTREHVINDAIKFQARVDSVVDDSVDVYIYNQSSETYTLATNISATDISPTGWTGFTVNSYLYTPTTAGIYQFRFKEDNWISDDILVVNTSKYYRRLVRVDFVNFENDFGYIFWDNSSNVFEGLTYFTGQLVPVTPKNDKKTYTNDRGREQILRASPIIAHQLNLNEIHKSYIKTINNIFSCTDIDVNGIGMTAIEVPEIEPTEKSDCVNITIQLTETKNNYFAIEL